MTGSITPTAGGFCSHRAMGLSSYLLRRPLMTTDAATTADFDALLDRACTSKAGGEISYPLQAPKWQFLCHAADRRGFVLHGSNRADITRFEPRQADDVQEFGNQAAVYGAADGIWPMFFAVLDRENRALGLRLNTCVRVAGEPDPFYFFSISRPALDQDPWRPGTVYLLPGAAFEAQPAMLVDGLTVRTGQMLCRDPVTPLGRLAVKPDDFPFLNQVRGHDDASTLTRIRAHPTAFPWLDGER